MKLQQCLVALAGFAGFAAAHMEMKSPSPIRSKHNRFTTEIDYSMTNPLEAGGGNFPCKGYHLLAGSGQGQSVASWKAGQSVTIEIEGAAPHGGGSCQASLSYDQGKSFKVIHSWMGDCPLMGQSSFPLKVPSDAQGGEVLFAWSWFNKIGNREMYMNCAVINIEGGSQPMSNRPDLFVANVANGCRTNEGSDVQFPNPGNDVTISPGAQLGAPVGSCGSASSGPQVPPPAEDDDDAEYEEPPASTPSTTSTTTSIAPTAEGNLQSPTQYTPPAPTSTSTSRPSSVKNLPGGVFITVTTSASEPSATPTTSSSAPEQPAVSDTPESPESPETPEPPANDGTDVGPLSGPCEPEGYWNCIGGNSFQRCASGSWSVVMKMAAGTSCRSGVSANFWRRTAFQA